MSILGASLTFLTAVLLSIYGRELLLWRSAARRGSSGSHSVTSAGAEQGLSIVVPVRNEKGRWEELVQDLLEAGVDRGRRELIFVDDHSTDGSKEGVAECAEQRSSFRFLELPQEKKGKKEALLNGVRAASYEWVLTLDADVRLGKEFLDELERELDRGADLFLLPVLPFAPKDRWQHFIYFEALALLGILIGSASRRSPLLANGAGMVFKRSVFWEEGGYQGHLHIDSGDDVLLLQDWLQKGRKVEVLPDRELLVRTRYPNGFKEWMDQRLRWASKSKAFKDARAIRTMGIIGGMNGALILHLLLLPFQVLPIFITLIAWGVKASIDGLFLTSSFQRLGKGFSWKHFPLTLFLYPFQVTFLPLLGVLRTPVWKGRSVQDH